MQDNLPTIELELTNAIKKITNEDTKIYGSGRTDKGVHARGQVIHFDTSKDIKEYKWMTAINTFLPDDIRILEVKIVDEKFHARFSATKKEYRYYIMHNKEDLFYRNYMAFCKRLDIDKMREALNLFQGTHNFQGFCSAEVDKRKDFVKTIYKADLIIKEDVLEFIFEGTGFLKYQIRRMMGLIIDIGLGRDSKEKILEVFEKKDPKISHKVAPANGLYLYKVTYEKEE